MLVNNMDIPKFEDLSEKKTLDGDKVKIDEILNKEIIVTGYHVSTSKYKDKGCGFCSKVQFRYPNEEEKKVFFSGSSVIKDQLEDMEKTLSEKNLPFLFQATMKKVGNYYSFT